MRQTKKCHETTRLRNIQAVSQVCFGQLILGVAVQILYIVAGKHIPALFVLTGFLMGFGMFGVLLGITTQGGKKITPSVWILPIMGLFLGASIAAALYFFV